MKIEPQPTPGRQSVSGYGAGGFRVSGVRYEGSVLVLPERTEPWPVSAPAEITLDSLRSVLEAQPPVELLLIGLGRSISALPRPLREALRGGGVAVEALDTGAACRTYNVLAGEGRRVAAALVALP